MSRLTRRQRLIAYAILTAAIYLPALGRPALWEPDEGRYAEIAREMIVSGDWITPHNDWVRYFEKPPLMYWASALSMSVLGTDEFAARLPAALFTIAEVVVTAAIAESMFGALAGVYAAIALALSPIVWGFGNFLTLDAALAFFMAAALGAFWEAQKGGLGDAESRRWQIVAAAMLALGTLAKGIVAPALFGIIAMAHVAVQKRLRELRSAPWRACGLVYLAIAAPWFVLVAVRNPGFIDFFFIHEHLQRYAISTEHAWGPWFLIAIAIGGAWPWIYFAPGGFAAHSDDARKRSAIGFLALWFFVVLVFFSIPRSKLGSYILPGIPPIAILAGRRLARLDEMATADSRRVFGGFAAVSLALGATAAIAIATGSDRSAQVLRIDAIAAVAALTGGAIASWAIVSRLGTRGAAAAIALGVLIAYGAGLKARGDGATLGSYRNLARAVTPYLQPGCVLASYRHHVQSLPFYTGAREALVGYRGELAPFSFSPDARASFIANDAELAELWRSIRCVVLIANRHDLDVLRPHLTPAPAEIGCEGKKVALYNRPVHARPIASDCR